MLHFKAYHFCSLIMFALLVISCNQTGQQTVVEASADSTNIQPPPVQTEEITAVAVSHHVKDFPKWTAAFFEHETGRKAAGLNVIGVFQDFEDPGFVSVTSTVSDLDAAKDFFASEDLKEAMKKAGAIDEPEIKFYNFTYMDTTVAKTSDNRMFVMHKVEDYDTWKTIFDENESTRKTDGLSVVVIARELEDPNEIAVSFTGPDLKTLKFHMDRPEIKESMKKAGVVNEPSIMIAKKLPISII